MKCGIKSKCRNPGFHGQYWTFMEDAVGEVLFWQENLDNSGCPIWSEP